MVKIIVVLILLYLVIGLVLFSIGLRQMGGKEEYIKVLEEKDFQYETIAFWLAVIVFTLVWPRYLFKK